MLWAEQIPSKPVTVPPQSTGSFGAPPNAKRLPLKEAKTITKIPVLKISYGDAQPLLAALAGPMAPEEWRGSLPIPYHVGPGPAQVHLNFALNWDVKPVYDVIAKINAILHLILPMPSCSPAAALYRSCDCGTAVSP